MRVDWARFQLGMELSRHEPGMVRELDNFHEVVVRIDAAEPHAVIREFLLELIIHFESMAMALGNEFLPVGLVGLRAF